jgi:hypothetical protein
MAYVGKYPSTLGFFNILIPASHHFRADLVGIWILWNAAVERI